MRLLKRAREFNVIKKLLIITIVLTEVAGFAKATEIELSWDTGVWQWMLCNLYGDDLWYGNDFDLATMGTDWRVKRIKLMSAAMWPNNTWDGARVGIFAFAGGQPGTLIWPENGVPKWFVGSGGPEPVWCEVTVNWKLPPTHLAFVAAWEQFYNWPNCDPICQDNAYGTQGHSWVKWNGTWYKNLAGNIMVRVIVESSQTVTPTSLGKVKALFY